MMNPPENAPFIPILTVMVDYGDAPFLWLLNSPDEIGVGLNVGNSAYLDESIPISNALRKKITKWAIAFDRTAFYSENFNADSWDWLTFHARGLRLSHRLKKEVGDAYRVVYDKPCEDPNHRIDERVEILATGALLPLPPFDDQLPAGFCQHVVSGGQTGADRAALDFAMKHGYTHGGWAPHKRIAEDGVIPRKYQLTEMDEGGYRQRTRRNVIDSDATLIVNLGDLDGGSLATQVYAGKSGKPCLVVPVDSGVSEETVAQIIAWLRQHKVKTLNIAGPRESKRPGIHRSTFELLKAVDASVKLARDTS
ncbi:MAG: putative molybdenum carrier protein [Candidatus Accumulibacter sp.]|jgi:hypothetical protein|nr:putative molybdenum carrier protein [Accumulibacter sp.]